MKYRYKTKPYPHQVRALKMLLRNGGGGLQVPMRWGKSKVGLDFVGCLRIKHGIKRVLVVTVTSGLGVWEDQIAQHYPLLYRTFDHHGELLDPGPEKSDGAGVDFMVVNFQNLYSRMNTGGREWVAVDNQALHKFNADVVIIDESHHIGNPTAVQSKHARKLGRKARFRVIMTGSMFHRKPFFVFGQALFYDDGASLGSAWTHFKKRVAVMGGYGGYEVLRYRNLKWMMDQLRPWVYMEEYVPPRQPVINPIRFDLTGKGDDIYGEMEAESIVEIEGKAVTAPIVLTRHLRLQQIAGGFLKVPGKGYRQVSTDKSQVLEDRLREYLAQGINKAVIGCRFLPELKEAARVGKRVGFNIILFHGGVPKGKERTRRVKEFKVTKEPTLFVSQISAGKESIDLSAADAMLFYSMTDSYVDHDQFTKRIEKFEDKRTLLYDFLLARHTRDEVSFEALGLKQDVAHYIIRNPKKVQEITRRKGS